jgi:hypothetical protein
MAQPPWEHLKQDLWYAFSSTDTCNVFLTDMNYSHRWQHILEVDGERLGRTLVNQNKQSKGGKSDESRKIETNFSS